MANWIKSSDRLPTETGVYFIKSAALGKIIAIISDLSQVHLYIKNCEWLDESESPAPSVGIGLVEQLSGANPYDYELGKEERFKAWERCCAKLRKLIEAQQEKSEGDDTCKRCGRKNPLWSAENELFNSVNGSPDGIMCPTCFGEMAEQKGIDVYFRATSKIPPPPLSGSIEEGECKKCNGSGLVSDPGKPEKYDCAYCNGSGKINTLYDMIAQLSYGGYLNNRITCKEAEEILSPFLAGHNSQPSVSSATAL